MTGRRGFLMSLGGLAGVLLAGGAVGGVARAATARSVAGGGGDAEARGLRTAIETKDGQLVRVEVLRLDRDGRSPAPVAQAGDVAIYVNNGGDGKMRTPPEVREAAEAFAKILAEKRLPALPTFRERVLR